MRIAHIADVHLRNLSRHAEFKQVFTAFAEKCRENNIDHIFVAGDIFHTKVSGMVPECIDILVWWVKMLSSVADLHLMLGNHDLNLANLDRQDAISPIISAIGNERVHFYKESGVYPFAPGFNWCIFSLVDEERWDIVKPIPGDVNIACYHGSVFGAMTEVDWLIEEGRTVDSFRDFTVAFLGDIHKFQFLGEKDVELEIDEADLPLYPGAEVIDQGEDV